jgi:PAS domain-containing protein
VKAFSVGAEELLDPNEKHTPPSPVMIGQAAAAFTLGRISDFSQDLLQELPVAVYTTDAEGRITSFNEAAVALWGCRPELGKSEYCGSYRLYWPDGTPLPHDQCPMAMTLRKGQPIRGIEAVAERPDGTRVALIPYPTPVFDATGGPDRCRQRRRGYFRTQACGKSVD